MEYEQALSETFSKGFYIVDSNTITNIFYPFALDEWLSRSVELNQKPIVHFWTHPKAFVLGLRDRKLPNIENALDMLNKQNNELMVRNSGGAAVPLDKGVLNLSIILPLKNKETINYGYEILYQLVKNALSTLSVKKGKVSGSYCPGDYDLSINGKKFCGISQRRWKKTYVVQAFILVEGEGKQREEAAKRFYQVASNDKTEILDFIVEENRMISLNEIEYYSVENLKENVIYYLETLGYGKSMNLEAGSSEKIQLLMDNLRKRYFN